MKEELGRLTRLKAEIAHELERLGRLQEELVTAGMEKAHPRVIGSILHDFYTGVERIFMRIAEELGEGLPRGEHWHRELLEDMVLELEGIRPAVISKELKRQLDEYLRFRHLFRSIYGFELEIGRLEPLVEGLQKVYSRFKAEINRFCKFLDQLISGLGTTD